MMSHFHSKFHLNRAFALCLVAAWLLLLLVVPSARVVAQGSSSDAGEPRFAPYIDDIADTWVTLKFKNIPAGTEQIAIHRGDTFYSESRDIPSQDFHLKVFISNLQPDTNYKLTVVPVKKSDMGNSYVMTQSPVVLKFKTDPVWGATPQP